MALFMFRYFLILVMLAFAPGEAFEASLSPITLGRNDPMGYSDWDDVEYGQRDVAGPLRKVSDAVMGQRDRSSLDGKPLGAIRWDMDPMGGMDWRIASRCPACGSAECRAFECD